MRGWPPAFEAFADAARGGKLGLWRLVLGIVAIVIATGLAFIVVSTAWVVARTFDAGEIPLESEIEAEIISLMSGASPGAVVFTLLAWTGLWAGTWVGVRLLQRRRMQTLFGARAGLFWSDFARAAAAIAVAGILVEGLGILLGSGNSISRGSIPLGQWFVWLLPVAAATLVQTSAEEIVFRGYLMQTLAARFRNPLVWALIPFVLFVLIHFDIGSSAAVNFLGMGFAALFAAISALLVWRTGNLGAAMGLHFLNNYLAFSLLGNDGFLNGATLFVYPPVSELTSPEIILALLASAVSLGLAMLLMFEPRSPLRLKSLDLAPSSGPVAKFGD
jgi:hypothetical protein